MENLNIQIQKIVEKLYQMIHDNESLKGKIVDILEKYLNDNFCQSDFFELERALGRLNPDLPGVIRNFLINMDKIAEWKDIQPELADFLLIMQEKYAYKYRINAFNTVLIDDKNNWYNAGVRKFSKNGNPHYGINVVRNDGQHLYFEGEESSINRLIAIIQTSMGKIKKTELGE